MFLGKSTQRLRSYADHIYQSNTRDICYVAFSAVSLIASLVLCISALKLEPTERQCDRQTYSWSPAFDQIKYYWSTEYVDLSTYTPYFDVKPLEKVEVEWNKLLPEHPISIPSSRLKELNHTTPSESPRWIKHPGGDDSVLALPEVFVQLGCLNFLRQWEYKYDHNYTYLPVFQGREELVNERAHQCLERLRHSIACWGDTSMILEHIEEPWTKIDFGTLHYCRDFDKIREWTANNAVKEVTFSNLWWGGGI